MSGSCRFLASTRLPATRPVRRAIVSPQPRVRSLPGRRGVEQVAVCAERLQIERTRDVHRVQQRERVRECKRPPGRRERILVEQDDGLAAGRLEVLEQSGGEVGHRGQVGLTDRAERPDRGKPALVQPSHDVGRELRPRGGDALGQRVRKPQRRGASDVSWCRRPLADQVLAHQQPVVPLVDDREGFPHADAGRHAVGRLTRLEQPLHDGACRSHPLERACGQLDRFAVARNGDDVVERQ